MALTSDAAYLSMFNGERVKILWTGVFSWGIIYGAQGHSMAMIPDGLSLIAGAYVSSTGYLGQIDSSTGVLI